jgi:hypothetical protein
MRLDMVDTAKPHDVERFAVVGVMSLDADFVAFETGCGLYDLSSFNCIPKHPVCPVFLWVALRPRQLDFDNMRHLVASFCDLSIFGARSFKVSRAPKLGTLRRG